MKKKNNAHKIDKNLQLEILLNAFGNDHFILYQNKALAHIYAKNLPKHLEEKWQFGCLDTALYPKELDEEIKKMHEDLLKTGEMQQLRTCLKNEKNEEIWYHFSRQCHYDAKGNILGFLTTAVNISSLKQCDDMLNGLRLEVNHRTKNLLAIIQSIANQTGQYSSSIDIFLTKFRGRIQSLANSQDLITQSGGKTTSLKALFLKQLSQYSAVDSSFFELVGDNPELFSDTSLYVGLALHELIMNSIAYGILKREKKSHKKKTLQEHIFIRTTVRKKNFDAMSLQIEWIEEFEHKKTANIAFKTGFGRAILEKIVPTSLTSKAQLLLNDKGVYYKLVLNGKNFHID